MINNENLYTPIVCDGIEDSFLVGIEYQKDESNIKIIRTTISTGAEETLVLGVNYTVDNDAETISTAVDPESPYPGTYKMVVLLNLPFTQLTDIVSNSNYDPEVLESAYDKNTLLAKQIKEISTRTVKLSEGDTGEELVLPPIDTLKNAVLGFDSDGNVVSYPGSVPRTYDPTYVYGDSEITQYSGDFYVSKVSANLANTPIPSGADAYWKRLSMDGMRWNSTYLYPTGFFVEHEGLMFKSAAGGVGMTPTVPDGDANWDRIFDKGEPGGIYPWDSSMIYKVAQVVSSGAKLYICLILNDGNLPADNPSVWKVWEEYGALKTALMALPTNQWDAGFKILATDPEVDDYFGYSVAISGDYTIVGSYGEDAGGSAAGAAYIYAETFKSLVQDL